MRGTYYLEYKNELETAKVLFNERAEKKKKARKIIEIEYASGGIVITLESKDELVNPSKLLTGLSHELTNMSTLANLKDAQNHLLCNNGVATEIDRDNEMFDDSTNAILKIVIDIFMGANMTDNMFVISGK